MQAALDSTALMLSKDLSSGVIMTSQISSRAQSYFSGPYTNTGTQSLSISATYGFNADSTSTSTRHRAVHRRLEHW